MDGIIILCEADLVIHVEYWLHKLLIKLQWRDIVMGKHICRPCPCTPSQMWSVAFPNILNKSGTPVQ